MKVLVKNSNTERQNVSAYVVFSFLLTPNFKQQISKTTRTEKLLNTYGKWKVCQMDYFNPQSKLTVK